MRAEVKIGIAVGVIVAVVAVLYVVFHEPGQKQTQVAEANAEELRVGAVVPGGASQEETIVPAFGGRAPVPGAGGEVAGSVAVSAGISDVAPLPPASQPGGEYQSVQATTPLAIKPVIAATTAPAAGVGPGSRLAPSPTAGTTTYIVQKGDMGFWAVAEKVYGKGKGKYWTVIEKANPNVDSNRLSEGTALKIPPLPGIPAAATPAGVTPPPTPVPSVAERVYTVQSNDSWWEISRKNYGDGRYHEMLQKANPQVTGALQPGQKIRIPSLGSLLPSGGAASAPARPAPPAEGHDRPVFE